jgi:LexA-binding, inner membrane-associated putative hydrolase
MYAGHFAAAMALKARAPRVPAWGLFLGVGVLDLLFGAFIVAGIERATVTPGISPGFRLDFIDWSHSLAMSIVWAVLYAALFVRQDLGARAVLALAVFSHFLCDWVMHPGDLALWPHSATRVGLGLWTRFPTGWWFFELGFIALCAGYYLAKRRGGRQAWVVAVVVLLHIVNSPWLSPTK